MSDLKFELNPAGVAELMKSPEMAAIIEEHTARIVAQAGAGYESNVQVGKNRLSGRVWPETWKAKRSNAKNETLLKAIKSGGGS